MNGLQEFRFGKFELDVRQGILREDDRPVELRPKTFSLLACLIGNAGRVMSKNELLDAVWPDVTVTEDSLTQCVGELRRALGDAAPAIRTISRRGYLFDKTILQSPAASDTWTPPPRTITGRPSIAVLPFRNLSSDSEQDYFADGVAEDITTALGHFRHIVVISRNSAFSFKEMAIGTAEIGRQLGVRYLLQGSVRKSGMRLRLTAQLVEAESGVQLWADHLDGMLTDIFGFQDEVTRQVIGAIAPRLMHAELERLQRKRPDSLDAYEIYLKAQASLRTMTREQNDLALMLIEQGLAMEPGYAALAGLGAWAYAMRAAQDWSVVSEPEQRKGIMLAEKALSIGQDDAEALSLAGYTLGYLGSRLEEGIGAVGRAIRLNQNSALAFTNSGWLKTYLGRPESAILDFRQAQSLSPHDPGLYRLNTGLCCAFILKGDYSAAVEAGRQATIENLNYVPALRALASALAHAGLNDEARLVVEQLSRLDVRTSTHAVRTLARFAGNMDRVLDGLRLAGLPE